LLTALGLLLRCDERAGLRAAATLRIFSHDKGIALL